MDLISTAGKPYFSNSALSGSNKLQVPEKIWWPFLSVFVEQAQRWPYDLVYSMLTFCQAPGSRRDHLWTPGSLSWWPLGDPLTLHKLFFQPLSTDLGNCLPLHTQGWMLMLIYGYLLPCPTRYSFTLTKWCSLNICSSFIWWDSRKHTFISKLK